MQPAVPGLGGGTKNQIFLISCGFFQNFLQNRMLVPARPSETLAYPSTEIPRSSTVLDLKLRLKINQGECQSMSQQKGLGSISFKISLKSDYVNHKLSYMDSAY